MDIVLCIPKDNMCSTTVISSTSICPKSYSAEGDSNVGWESGQAEGFGNLDNFTQRILPCSSQYQTG